MPGWDKDNRYKVRLTVKNDVVRCYIDQGGFVVTTYDKFDRENYKALKDPYSKTFAIYTGSYDGEYIDLFDLQEWFDKNREWVNSLREEIKIS